MRSYGPDTDFQYVCTVTLTLEIWPWVKVMTHPCVKLYPDRTREYEVMARTRCEQTDRQTDRVIPIYPPPNFVCGGYKNTNLVEDKDTLLPVKFRWIPLCSFRGVENVSANQSPGRPSCFSDRPKYTNFVENVKILLPVEFHWSFREEVENV